MLLCLQNPRLVAVAIGAVIGLIAQFGDQIDISGGGWSNLLDDPGGSAGNRGKTIGEAIGLIREGSAC